MNKTPISVGVFLLYNLPMMEKISFENKDEENQFKKNEPLNTLHSEHLTEGFSPIIASISSEQSADGVSPDKAVPTEQYRRRPFPEVRAGRLPEPKEGTQNVDWFAQPEKLDEQHFIHGGEKEERTYVISPLNEQDKFSHEFINCVGVVVTGKDKETGNNISFFVHATPLAIISDDHVHVKERFIGDLHSQMEEIKKRSVAGSIDAVMFGGNYLKMETATMGEYIKMMKLVSGEMNKDLGFEPVIMTGPKTGLGEDNVYYDNKNRRLHIVRPETGVDSSAGYLPKDIMKKEKEWKGEANQKTFFGRFLNRFRR